LVTVHTGAETIQGRKLFKGGNYSRKYGLKTAEIGEGVCFVGSLLRTHVLKKDDRKEGSSRRLVTVLVMMPFLNTASAGLSSEELNKVLC